MTLAVIGMPAAHADIHGWVSISNSSNLTSGDGGPVNAGGPCNFTSVAGDTYSGGGPFAVDYPVDGVVTTVISHAATNAPAGATAFTWGSGSNVNSALVDTGDRKCHLADGSTDGRSLRGALPKALKPVIGQARQDLDLARRKAR